MATVTLGNIKFNWKGPYNNSTAYVVDDVVSSGGSSYVCILASTGNAVSNGTYWQQMSAAGTNGTDLTTTLTTQGDIVYRDGSGLARLAAGTSGQVLQTGQFLKTQGTGANPVWAESAGGILQFQTTHYASDQSTTSQTESATSLSVSITPSSASNKIWVEGQVGGTRQDGNGSLYLKIYRQINGGGYSVWRTIGDGWYLYASQTTGHAGFSWVDTTHNSTNQVDYKLYFRSENGTTVGFNMGGASSTINAIELGV